MPSSLQTYRALIAAVTEINNAAADLNADKTDKAAAADRARAAAEKLLTDLTEA